jgi:hypothetical protein
MRIDEPRYEKSAAPVYPPRVRTRNQTCADFSDRAVADDNICMKQRTDAFRRDQSDIFNYDLLINYALCLCGVPNVQNDEGSQCRR